jgi:hypothetical protein
MKRHMKRTVVLVLLAIYLLTPYSLFGFTGGGCACSIGQYKCGENGYVCFCCRDLEFDSGTPAFTKCRIGAKFFSYSQPPALPDLMPCLDSSSIYLNDISNAGADPFGVYLALPEKPPSV